MMEKPIPQRQKPSPTRGSWETHQPTNPTNVELPSLIHWKWSRLSSAPEPEIGG